MVRFPIDILHNRLQNFIQINLRVCELTRIPFWIKFTDVVEKAVEVEDFEKLAKDLENASPLEIMDKALEKYGNDIAIAFR